MILMKKTALSCAIFIAFFNPGAIAADDNLNTSPEQHDIENITVYAQKRAQKTQDVSVAISVLQAELIEKLNLKHTTHL